MSANKTNFQIGQDYLASMPTMENAAAALTPSTTTEAGVFLGMTWQTWLIIILLLAVLGFNVFTYLAEGSQFFANIISQVLQWFTRTFGISAVGAIKQTVDVSAVGLKTTVDTVTDTAVDAVDNLATKLTGPEGAPASSSLSQTNQPIKKQPQQSQQQEQIQNALNRQSLSGGGRSGSSSGSGVQQANFLDTIEADDSFSSIQANKASSKSGFCYIGADKGTRSCVSLGVNDQCMSGQIFPTMEVCVNPSLRA